MQQLRRIHTYYYIVNSYICYTTYAHHTATPHRHAGMQLKAWPIADACRLRLNRTEAVIYFQWAVLYVLVLQSIRTQQTYRQLAVSNLVLHIYMPRDVVKC